ncbi:MAG: hypothetical protein AcusKO_22410 [Acuticoccus sp.]
MINIDASTLTQGIDYSQFLEEYYTGLSSGSSTYHGGEPDAAFGGMYYVSGPEVSFTYGDENAQMALLVGEEIAYDFIHYGPAFGHGISGEVNEVIFGYADEHTGTDDDTPNGLVTGLDVGVRVTGLELVGEPGAGNDPETNPVYAIYDAVRNGLNVEEGEDHIATLYDIFGAEAQSFTGSFFDDTYVGTDWGDSIRGNDGDDDFRGHDADDMIFGGAGNDFLGGGKGVDVIRGGLGDDTIEGGAKMDKLFGGEGGDSFLYTGANQSKISDQDRILDFETGVDNIDLTALELTLVEEFTGTADEVLIETVRGKDFVRADMTGDGENDFSIMVRNGTVEDGDLLL